MVAKFLKLEGVRTHNLRDLNVEIPRDQMVAVTGPSGSGKSSLLFDTIHAEGQRRYVESLSVGARQFLTQLARPELDRIDGLSPTVALAQDGRAPGPRSTLGTLTEIQDFLRLLFARLGEVFSYRSGAKMTRYSVEQMVEQGLALGEGTRFSVLAPLRAADSVELAGILEGLAARGFVRVGLEGRLLDLDGDLELDGATRADLYVDRLVLKEGVRSRLAEAVELALRIGEGRVSFLCLDGRRIELCERYFDPADGEELAYPEIRPASFSFNHPDGACEACAGLGRAQNFDVARLISQPERGLGQGALDLEGLRGAKTLVKKMLSLLDKANIAGARAWQELEPATREALLFGGRIGSSSDFEGLRGWLERRQLALLDAKEQGIGEPDKELELIASLMRDLPCPECGGARLRVEMRHVKVGGHSLPQLAGKTLSELEQVLRDYALGLEAAEAEIADSILAPIFERLSCLQSLGLGYLSLDRVGTSLSGGELQRARLAAQIGAALVGVTYVLDEPSAGLHASDISALLRVLAELRARGNTLLLVEHDLQVLGAADHLIEMGPGAGAQGGEIVVQGTPEEVAQDPRSLTQAYRRGRKQVPGSARAGPARQWLELDGATGHNLRSCKLRVPLGRMSVVTGPSGSGKSSLIVDTLLPALKDRIRGSRGPQRGLPFKSLKGGADLERVVAVDQSPLGKSPRSSPATYTGVFAELRSLFAEVNDAKLRGYGPARFSFNVKGGRCEACQGSGAQRIEMHFLPDHWVQCQVCQGRRYNRETLGIRYRGLNIHEALSLRVTDAADFFHAHRKIHRILSTLRDVGLGYLALGQSSATLSGGEAQRVKLARELAKRGGGPTLFVLDEPCRGLHLHDIAQLVALLQDLCAKGDTVVCTEHQLDFVAAADWVVDMGPGPGSEGGRVVAEGPVASLAQGDSPSAEPLRARLGERGLN